MALPHFYNTPEEAVQTAAASLRFDAPTDVTIATKPMTGATPETEQAARDLLSSVVRDMQSEWPGA